MTINDMYPAIVAILMIGMVLGVGIYVLTSFHDAVRSDYTGTQNAINTSAATTLTDSALDEFNLVSLTAEYTNGTDLTVTTDFTYTVQGVVTWSAAVGLQNGTSLVNTTYVYNYDKADTAETAVTTTTTGIGTFADWIAIIVVVLAAAIVLGIVLSSFGRRNTI